MLLFAFSLAELIIVIYNEKVNPSQECFRVGEVSTN